MSTHITTNNIDEPMQSSYKAHHSTETAMMRVYNDILCIIDQKKYVLLVCLDLSAAFDIVDHNILLNRLEQRIGITDKCLMWFRSYLHNCKQSVSINGVTSSQKDLCCGVPQGSV